MNNTLTRERLLQVVSYDPQSGVFLRLVKTNQHDVGLVAGSHDADGYRVIKVDGKKYRAARLAWLYVHGVWPREIIDHKNGVRDDDRLDNLREATLAQNATNSKPYAGSGLKGAYRDRRDRGRWFSFISVDRKKVHLGRFDTKEEAHAAYVRAAREFRGEFARAG